VCFQNKAHQQFVFVAATLPTISDKSAGVHTISLMREA
jgi:hypothetical protein